MKERIVFVTNNFSIGGVERLILNIASHLDKDRFDVGIVTVFGDGPLREEFLRSGAKIYFAGPRWPISKSRILKLLWLFFTPIIFLRIVLFLRRVKPEAVFTSLYQSDTLGLPAAKAAGIKGRISIQHDVVNLASPVMIIKRIVLYLYATRVIAISRAVARFTEEVFMVSKNKISIISNGIDFEKFCAGRGSKNSYGVKNICYVGRLESVKGPRVFIEALALLKKDGIPFNASVVGGGSLKKELMDRVEAAGITASVKFYGEVSDVVPFLQAADLAVVPSLSEGFGLTVIEGLAAGKPVIASDLPAIREIINSGSNGFLFKPGDAFDMKEKIKRVLSDDRFPILKRNVEGWIIKNKSIFGIEATVRRYVEIARGGLSSGDSD
ncbi:MAG: glycosyltransferase [Patescibacteria group bacterium]|nr:glycosyltransferase [Patescibacteria group bacterium]